jgi:two-component system cell cycle sensor histidine kinase/response regulator CckA
VSLLLNATDALNEGGTIQIKTEDAEGRIILKVADDGIGMDAQTLNRVFEPFFTTKAEVGAGLGLATVHGTRSRWGGTTTVRSEPGKGSEFTLTFPRSWQTPSSSSPPEPSHETRTGRILIAEDDEIVREILTISLTDHDLVIVEDGQKALDAIEKNRFDVALIDLSLPFVAGDKIARQIRLVDPKVVTVLMTGWDLSEDDPRRVPFDDHIPKPISSRKDLQEVVARSLQVHDARKLRE